MLKFRGNSCLGMTGEQSEDWRGALVRGGDERIEPKERSAGRNRYNLNPLDPEGLFYRGSCTCGVLSEDTLNTMGQLYERFIEDGDEDIWADEQRSRIQKIMDPSGRSEVFFGPSGTDLLYYPLLFARSFSSRPILNILSCPEELGSGSRLAVAGKGFSLKTASGASQDKGALLHPDLGGEVVELPARTHEGHIRDRKSDIRSLIQLHSDKTVIVHLVFGSKSGIKDDLDVIESHPNVIWTVDLCQFRADPELIESLLSRGAMILITGSKFYQAPPFCGALLVPKTWADSLNEVSKDAAAGLSEIFVKSDIPGRFQSFRHCLKWSKNPSSRMRWECALTEMEACHSISRQEIDATIDEWNQVVCSAIEQHDQLDLIPDQAKTNASIVSFRVRDQRGFLGGPALKQLFDRLTMGNWEAELGYKRLFIGQPVCYGDKWFIRVALGSRSARLASGRAENWSTDVRMVNLMGDLAMNPKP